MRMPVAVRIVPLFLATLIAGCSSPPEPALPVPDSVPAPNPAEIESVIFLLGDPGSSYLSTSPALARAQQEIEWWSSQLAADSSVSVFVLGDVRYPEGVRDPGSAAYEADTAVVMSQVLTVAGPRAVERGAAIYFMAGNHDWGLREHWEGFVRLVNLDAVLAAARERGINAHLIPQAGTGGPHVIDWGRHLRLLVLDTAWWLLAGDDPSKAAVIDSVATAVAGAGNREIMLMAHHPYRTAGSHGGQFSFWSAGGVRYLLHRSGAILQDITSRPFRELETGLRDIFEVERPPLAFLAGHDHSLQVISAEQPTDPRFNIVSGSVSKLSEVGRTSGLVFGTASPGYMKIFVERDGGVVLYVDAADARFQHCPTTEPARAQCMEEGVRNYRTVYWTRMK